MCDCHEEDPRDTVYNAQLAITGVTDMLLSGTEPVERDGLVEVLHLVNDKLKAASQELRHYTRQN